MQIANVYNCNDEIRQYLMPKTNVHYMQRMNCDNEPEKAVSPFIANWLYRNFCKMLHFVRIASEISLYNADNVQCKLMLYCKRFPNLSLIILY